MIASADLILRHSPEVQVRDLYMHFYHVQLYHTEKDRISPETNVDRSKNLNSDSSTQKKSLHFLNF